MAIEQGYQAEASVDEFNGQKAIIKRSRKQWYPGGQAVGSWMLKREARILDRLSNVECVPDFLGHPDETSIALEFVEGLSIRELDQEDRLGELPESFFEQLHNTLRGIHEKGVVHSDLKKKENLIVTPDKQPAIIDFGSALERKDNYRFINNFLFDQFKVIDGHAVLKLKYMAREDLLTAEEREELMDLSVLEKVSRWGRRVLPFRQDPPPLSQRYD